jgi:cytochrome c
LNTCAPRLGVVLAALLAGCNAMEEPGSVQGGEPRRGQLLLEQYDCGSCHVIPGVRRAQGMHGPTLAAFAHRAYIAGELPNQPELLVRWIRHPRSLVADTTMPDLGVPQQHARDMGAYLMDLR